MKTNFILSISFLLLLSCSKRLEHIADGTIYVDFFDDRQDAMFNYSDYLDSVSYVPLETSDSCLVGDVRDIHYVNHKFYVSDIKSIFVFAEDGKFLSKVSRSGRGHGEYLSLSYFDVNKSNGEICVYDQGKQMVHIYSQDGSFIRDVGIEGIPRDFSVLPNGNFLFYTPDVMPNHYRGVWQTDGNGNLINQPVVLPTTTNKVILTSCNFIHLDDEEIGLMGPMGFDYIYHISSDTSYVSYEIKTNFEISRKILKMDNSESLPPGAGYTLIKYFETQRFISFIMLDWATKQKTIMYDKFTGKVYNRTTYQDGRIPTSFDMGDKAPFYIPEFRSEYGICFGFLSASMLMNHPLGNTIYPDCKSELNPILCIYYYK